MSGALSLRSRKSSVLGAAVIQRGIRPRPVQAFVELLETRYLTPILPLPVEEGAHVAATCQRMRRAAGSATFIAADPQHPYARR